MAHGKVKSLLAAVKDELCLGKFGLSHDVPSLFVGAQCFNAPAYLIWSGIWGVFFFSMLMLDIYYNKNEGGEYFIYLTNLTYMFQTSSLLIDFGVTIYVNLQRNNDKGENDKMAWYIKIQWVMFNVTNTASFLVTLLYYTMLSPGADPVYEPLDWAETGNTIILTILVIFVACPAVHTFIFFTLYTVRLYVFQRCCSKRMEVKPEVTGLKFESRDKNDEKDCQGDIVNKWEKY